MAFIIRKKEHIPHSFERLVNNLINNVQQSKQEELKSNQTIYPKINILEKGDVFEIQFALAGWTKSEVEIQVDKDNLIVKGNKGKSVKQDITYHSYEFDYGQFEKQFALPEDKFGDVNAEMKDGILTITILKREKTESHKKITVQ